MHVLIALVVVLAASQAQNTGVELTLIEAVKKGSVENVRKAVTAGASVDTRIVERTKPSLSKGQEGGEPYFAEPVITLAIHREHVHIVKFLLGKGADPSKKDESGWTPLMHASRSEKPLVSILIAAKARVNDVNQYGETALTYACNYGPVGNVRQLLEAGTNPNIGEPLRTAIDSDNLDVVKLLLKHRANPNKVAYGYSAYEYALLHSKQEISKALRLAGGKGRPLTVLQALQASQTKKWDAEIAAARKKEKAEAAASVGVELDAEDKILIEMLIKDLAKSKEIWLVKSVGSVVCSLQTQKVSGFESDDQLNGDLDEKAADVTLAMRKSLHDRNRKEMSLKGKLDRSVELFDFSTRRGAKSDLELEFMSKNKVWVAPLLPGYSPDRNAAVLRFAVGPSSHGANGTYLFKKTTSGWTIAWRDFSFYA